MNTSSRYTSQDIQKALPPFSTRDEFEPRELLDQAYLVETDQYVEYLAHDGDRIDRLAFEFLGDSRLWNILAEMNPEVDPQFIPAGVRLRIPRVDGNRG
jgi:hypothetical protein